MKNTLILALALSCFPASAETRIEEISHDFCFRNQGNTNTCWLHSAVQMMEQAAGATFSVDALAVQELKSRAIAMYDGHYTPWDGGAGPTRPFALALEHGLIPEVIYKPRRTVVGRYQVIYQEIEESLLPRRGSLSRSEFLEELDTIFSFHGIPKPPKAFQWRGREWTPKDLAETVITEAPSIGYDFRDIQYDDEVFGRMPEVPWTTIMGADGELKKIQDIIEKKVIRTTPEEVWAKIEEFFRQRVPLAFTFIYFDEEGERTHELRGREYVSIRPPVEERYTSSHLVLIQGLVYENEEFVGLRVVDPLASSQQEGIRYVSRDFFDAHGKTLHVVMPSCDSLLR